jgi:hypothetical protein
LNKPISEWFKINGMKLFYFLVVLCLAGCRNHKNDSLLGRWQIILLKGKDSSGKEVALYNAHTDTTKRYLSFINDTSIHQTAGPNKKAADTINYLLVGDTIFSKRGIRNYSLDAITSDSMIITGDDQSKITIVRMKEKNP